MIENSGGGGGGNGGAGGLGGNTWNSNLPRGGFGGAVFPHATDRLALGGGGGSGSNNNSAEPQFEWRPGRRHHPDPRQQRHRQRPP